MSAMLAELLRQAQDEGASVATLRGIAEEAGEVAAARALDRLGLSDAGAAKDMAELRELLAAWRDAKRSAVKALIGWIARMACAVLLVGLAVRLGFGGWVK
ncbi:DUF6127 family protein [Sphingomonas qomolangmaensis]|uniref:DUF6127 family protein n=2 Tax=Sphingomonas qomolangmaensis TaxID=2918765 RepID=A0ABY5L588_9SPHN|nr:DUF6127 family protein [Sphingomonas qomolangmaensis]UUL82108.1 DUF6127 family protein [Sphingomonas qomolangmaensis]